MASGAKVDVFQIKDLSKLKLFWQDETGHPFLKFEKITQQLTSCETLMFAMNAGMYHPDYAPVGLYIENGKELNTVNQQQGFGNFFMQPNGVLAWNSQQAVIKSTQNYKNLHFNAEYATQSGPMLVFDGQINPHFLPNSNSLKIRNGVGIKENKLYFAISRNPVNFYQFADFFKTDLNIENALYLDGSISSLYFPEINRRDRRYKLGPMLAVVTQQTCIKP